MRMLLLMLIACAMAGCASPPKPAQCEGDFRPVNKGALPAELSTSVRGAAAHALCVGGTDVSRG